MYVNKLCSYRYATKAFNPEVSYFYLPNTTSRRRVFAQNFEFFLIISVWERTYIFVSHTSVIVYSKYFPSNHFG